MDVKWCQHLHRNSSRNGSSHLAIPCCLSSRGPSGSMTRSSQKMQLEHRHGQMIITHPILTEYKIPIFGWFIYHFSVSSKNSTSRTKLVRKGGRSTIGWDSQQTMPWISDDDPPLRHVSHLFSYIASSNLISGNPHLLIGQSSQNFRFVSDSYIQRVQFQSYIDFTTYGDHHTAEVPKRNCRVEPNCRMAGNSVDEEARNCRRLPWILDDDWWGWLMMILLNEHSMIEYCIMIFNDWWLVVT